MNVSVRRCLALCASLVPTCGPAIAAPTDTPGRDGDLEEIVVTGSRIQLRLKDAPVVVGVISRDDIERASQDAIGKVLQQLPVNTGHSSNTNANNGGDGATRVNLRGLGSERTLVLVNGRRFVYGGNGGNTSVDVNMIPLSVVQRVEVVGVGASTIYGSDAIGGVVNLITRDDYTGAEITGSYRTSEEGDGQITNLQFVAGQSTEHGYLAFGSDLVDQHAVFCGDREYSARAEYIREDGSIATGGSPSTPQGVFDVPDGNALGLPPEVYTRVEGSGEPTTAADFRPFVPPDDLYNFAPINYLQTPSERETVWLLAGIDINDQISVFVEALTHHRDSEQLLAPTPFFSFSASTGTPILPNGEPASLPTTTTTPSVSTWEVSCAGSLKAWEDASPRTSRPNGTWRASGAGSVSRGTGNSRRITAAMTPT